MKSVKIRILKQKNQKLYGFQIKFCEDKKMRFCDVPSAQTACIKCWKVQVPVQSSNKLHTQASGTHLSMCNIYVLFSHLKCLIGSELVISGNFDAHSRIVAL
jgi:hypothetical protein